MSGAARRATLHNLPWRSPKRKPQLGLPYS
jgi:hypothetical protein